VTTTTGKRQPTKPKSPKSPKPKMRAAFPLRIHLVLQKDGERAAALTFELQVPQTPETQGVQVALPVDVRQLAAAIEPIIGPTTPQPAKPKLWTPRD